jgi:hypothetical protein
LLDEWPTIKVGTTLSFTKAEHKGRHYTIIYEGRT